MSHPQVVSKDIMQQRRIAVSSEADLVVMQLGNVTVKLPYATAFQLSQWLRVRAKEAKRFAGDTSQHWSLLGTLTDANKTRG
jgi:hypothetical protein